MKLYVCVTKDLGSQQFGQPMCVVSLGASMRAFGDEVNRPSDDNLMYKHPQDFELYHLGEYDTDTAVFTLLERPAVLARGVEAAKTKPQG